MEQAEGGMVLEVKLRDVCTDDIHMIERWYVEIDGRNYLSRFRPKDSYFYGWYIIEADGIGVGTVWLEKEHLQDNTAALGIMIGNKDIFGKGVGERAIRSAIGKCRQILGFNSVILNVRESNSRAKKCYEKCGFKLEGIYDKFNEKGEGFKVLRMILEL
ncbi:acetyltransferase (GNAT) family protein [Ruminiclostridium hungatei]|uniref:Acetyltransferase (GNAT) family protein n=1 Tax=Ruminiclostridium hungatei TaxID=48256 RepID=A0A1V4SFZ5_RUMHU|nr:GNAT family protein [Ruminiclostridium hungatei]OPX42788.1 acetyltransferase (GNAT) family protein [Ruminiclostridium hungatei]